MQMQADISLFIICELSLMLVVDVLVIFLPDVQAMMYMRSSCHAYLLLFFIMQQGSRCSNNNGIWYIVK